VDLVNYIHNKQSKDVLSEESITLTKEDFQLRPILKYKSVEYANKKLKLLIRLNKKV